jgi:hypothetical protein
MNKKIAHNFIHTQSIVTYDINRNYATFVNITINSEVHKIFSRNSGTTSDLGKILSTPRMVMGKSDRDNKKTRKKNKGENHVKKRKNDDVIIVEKFLIKK